MSINTDLSQQFAIKFGPEGFVEGNRPTPEINLTDSLMIALFDHFKVESTPSPQSPAAPSDVISTYTPGFDLTLPEKIAKKMPEEPKPSSAVVVAAKDYKPATRKPRAKWTDAQDRILINNVRNGIPIKLFKSKLPGYTEKQIYNRWQNTLKSRVKSLFQIMR